MLGARLRTRAEAHDVPLVMTDRAILDAFPRRSWSPRAFLA